MKGLELFANQSIIDAVIGDNGNLYLRVSLYGAARLSVMSTDRGDSFQRLVKNPEATPDPDNNDYDFGFSSTDFSLVRPNRVFLRSPVSDPNTVYWTEDDGHTFRVIGPDPNVLSGELPDVISVANGVAGIPTADHWSIIHRGATELTPTNVPVDIDYWAKTSNDAIIGFEHFGRVYYKSSVDDSIRLFSTTNPQSGKIWPIGTVVGPLNDSVIGLVSQDGNVFILTDRDSIPRLVFEPRLDHTRRLAWTDITSNGIALRFENVNNRQDQRMTNLLIDARGRVIASAGAPGRSTTGGTLSHQATKNFFLSINEHRWITQQWTSTNTGKSWWALRRQEATDSIYNRFAYEVIGKTDNGDLLFTDCTHTDLYRIVGDTVWYVNSNTAPVTYVRTPGSRVNPDRTMLAIEGVPHISLTDDEIWIAGNAVTRWSHDHTLIDTVLRKRCLVLDREDTRVAYAGTDTLYRSIDNGRTWHSRLSLKDLTKTEAMYVKISDIAHEGSDTVVIGLSGVQQSRAEGDRLISLGGMWTSFDGGIEWTQATGIDTARQILQLESLGDGKFVALTRYLMFEQIEDTAIAQSVKYARATAVARSTDGGRTWDDSFSALESVPVILDNPAKSSLTVVRDTIWFAHPSLGLFRSVDGGASFQPSLASIDVQPTSVVTMEGGVVVGGKGGLYLLENPDFEITSIDSDNDEYDRNLRWHGSLLLVDECFVGGNVLVYDLTGQVVERQTEIGSEVRLDKFAAGTYIVVLTDKEQSAMISGLYCSISAVDGR